ncbi:MAG TPA: V-type ATP synthase subunit D [Clostridia bacterium]
MDMNVYPTKGNLIRIKSILALSKQGYELLDKKRNILLREMMELIDKAGVIQEKIRAVYKQAYEALQIANIRMGISEVQQLGYAVPEERSVRIQIRSVMGVEIPSVDIEPNVLSPRYGFLRTNLALDTAYRCFEEVKQLTVEYAEVENSVYRLANNIRRTQKRANSLKNVLIPMYERMIKTIQESLEEKEREEFTRLKIIKKSNINN